MQALRDDHSRLSRVFREIDLQQALLGSHAREARPVLEEAMAYLLHYQDGFHHAREDHLFDRIARRLPGFSDAMDTLVREHASGKMHGTQIAADLANASLRDLEGPRGRRLAQRLRAHVAHARAHIRREEDVFYGHAEDGLDPADWVDLMRLAAMEDPLSSTEQMHALYPLLAHCLDMPVSEVAGPGATPARPAGKTALRLRAVARAALEQAVEASGRLALDAVDLTRSNARSLHQARTPAELLLVGPQIGLRNARFALHCLLGPSRMAAKALASKRNKVPVLKSGNSANSGNSGNSGN